MNAFFIILTGVVIVISIMWYLAKYNDLISPFMLIAVICFLVQVVGPMYWVIEGKTDYWGFPIMQYMVQNELIFIAGYIAFWIAYSRPYYKPIKITGEELYVTEHGKIVDCDRMTVYVLYWFLFVLYCIYLATRGISLLSQLSFGQLGVYSDDILSESDANIWFLLVALDMLIPLSCIIIEIGKTKFKFIYFIVTFLLVIASGKRHLMLDMAIAPIIVHFSMRNKKPKTSVVVIGAVFCYLLVGWIGAMRGVYRSGAGELVAYNSESAWDAIMVNLEVFKSLSIFIPHFKSISDLALGTSYITAFIQLIPTIIFPGKSKLIAFLSVGTLKEAYSAALLKSGVAGTFWSLLYANGLVVGVIIGMFALGRWAKRLSYRKETNRLTYIVEYAVLTSFSFQILTRSFGSALQTWFALVIPLIILRKVYFRGN